MPVLDDGTVVRSRYTFLKLRELSSVDNPAQPGALMTIMKRHEPTDKDFNPNQPRDPAGGPTGGRWRGSGGGSADFSNFPEGKEPAVGSRVEFLESNSSMAFGEDVRPFAEGEYLGLTESGDLARIRMTQPRTGTTEEIEVDPEDLRHALVFDKAALKYVCENDGAHSFLDVLRENKFSQEIWPCVDALSQSIRSIVGDGSLTGAEREVKITSSVDQFLASVRDISPEVSKQLSELVAVGKDDQMPKSIEELSAEVEKLTGQLTSANALVAAEKGRADTAEASLTAEQTAHTATKAALTEATDEVITVGGTELKKSVVGEANFSVTKALQDDRDLAQLEKRAMEEFPHVVGTTAEKALVLKSINGLEAENPTRKAVEAILKSAEKMTSLGFERLGVDADGSDVAKASGEAFMTKVHEIQKRDDCKEHEAMTKARSEHPELFEAYQEGSRA